VILATACAPSSGNPELAKILGIELNPYGFFKTDPSQPMDTTRPGIFTCGCAHSPIDIPESVAQASGAAARAARTVMGAGYAESIMKESLSMSDQKEENDPKLKKKGGNRTADRCFYLRLRVQYRRAPGLRRCDPICIHPPRGGICQGKSVYLFGGRHWGNHERHQGQ
jgi:heterodisulfide reductase subunit A-like polyferredoxin